MIWERHYDELAYGDDPIERRARRSGEPKFDRVETVRARSFSLPNIGIARGIARIFRGRETPRQSSDNLHGLPSHDYCKQCTGQGMCAKADLGFQR